MAGEGSVTKKTKRLVMMDYAKALAIVFMVLVHVFEVSRNSGALVLNTDFEVFLGCLIEFTGGILSAGVFTFILGFFVGTSTSKTTEKLITEAGHLFLLGLLVNVFQQWLPVLFRGNIPENFLEQLPAILAADIYTFDSLCMLCFAAVFCFKEEIRKIIALIAVIAAFLLSMTVGRAAVSTGNVWLDTFLGFFIRINEWSYFPLLNWLPFPFIGFIIGNLYKTDRFREKHVSALMVFGVFAVLYGTFMMNRYGLRDAISFGTPYTEGDYYAVSGYNLMVALGLIFLIFPFYRLIVKSRRGKIPKELTFLSMNVSDIYVFQWLLIGLLTYPLDRIRSIYVNILMSLLVLAGAVALKRYKNACIFRKSENSETGKSK